MISDSFDSKSTKITVGVERGPNLMVQDASGSTQSIEKEKQTVRNLSSALRFAENGEVKSAD